ncbi:MAG: hypothetical protein MZW92_17610 [Comamonadaceae bacterium]|nr:hypothetical protein [Comamonadaceae bacterium]
MSHESPRPVRRTDASGENPILRVSHGIALEAGAACPGAVSRTVRRPARRHRPTARR